METATKPIESEIRAPWRTRLSMSRPYWSLPSTKRAPGGWSASRGAVLIGSRGLNRGAITASTARRPRTPSPTAAPRCRTSRRSAPGRRPSAVSDARVQDGIGQVHQQVDDDVGGRDEEDRALHQREVLVQDPADDEPAEARPAEDGLDDDGAGQEVPELQAEDGHHRDGGVLQAVADHHRPPGQPLRPGRADVVLAEHLQHA